MTTGSLAMEALSRISGLLRKELNLAKAETAQSLHALLIGLGTLVGAVVLALTALNVLSAALVTALVEWGIEPPWASLIVGVSLALIAAIMAWVGAKKIQPDNLVPKRTVEQVRRDAEELKEAL